jgi:hypothetical protein
LERDPEIGSINHSKTSAAVSLPNLLWFM